MRRPTRFSAIFALPSLLCAAFSTSLAQAPPLERDTTVRFRVGVGGPTQFGRLAMVDRDSLVLRSCVICNQLVYSRAEVTSLEIYRGSSRPRHILIGGLAGTLIGLGLGVSSDASCNDSSNSSCEFAVLAIPLGAIAGGLIGIIVGAIMPGEKWEPLRE